MIDAMCRINDQLAADIGAVDKQTSEKVQDIVWWRVWHPVVTTADRLTGRTGGIQVVIAPHRVTIVGAVPLQQ